MAANRIASWDGISWSPLGSGINDFNVHVQSLTVYDGKLIAGGEFTAAGGVAANLIASWDGNSWSPLGSGMSGFRYPWVHSLTVYDGKLVAGGYFTRAGGVAANYIASWDGSNWSPLGSGMNGSVYALTVHDGKLIAGGQFTTAGGVAANLIASRDGRSWSPLGTGIGGKRPYVWSLTVYDRKLIAGGYFTIAGNKFSAYLARWTKEDPTDVVEFDPDKLPTHYNMSQSYPNPFNPTTTIEFNLPKRSNVTVKIYNVLGRQVQSLVDREFSVGNYKVTWDGSTFGGGRASTGVYFYRIVTEDFTETKKMVLLK